MFLHVAYGMSFRKVEGLFREFFGLHIGRTEISEFKSLMAHYYKTTYKTLLKKILAGNSMHTDDTNVKLRTGKRSVTVFANLEEVVFMLRPTEETDHIRMLLKDFQGVLISDFHVKYDFYPGPQQKCLIHLMRDMNQDLLNNPYDNELQFITQAFGILLRAVVETVDEHGLKRRFLKRHEKDIARFFHFLSAHTFKSEVSRSIRDRLIKYQNKLFTFTKFDGVPWNNNNAENAIKRLADYREDTAGTMRESGLSDYLVLLSVYQTCRCKGISFLQFLLSRNRDLDSFRDRKRKKKRFCLETYPKGLTPGLVNLTRARALNRAEGFPYAIR